MSGAIFDLEQASWPVLLVDAGGTIRRANPTAHRLFAGKIGGEGTPLASIWAPDNSLSQAQFLARGAKPPPALQSIRLCGPANSHLPFTACVSGLAEGVQTLFLIQLFPADGTGEGKGLPGDTYSQRQKLECALQLTRTVSLDFNNTLTTVLGHASYLLGQAPPDHPWRTSLVEIEKAAAHGAEIANHLAAFSSDEKDARSRAAANLNHLLRRTIELFQTPQHGGLSWVLQLENRLFATRYDEAKLQQAIVKVLENAVQAVQPDGRIIVQTRNLECSEPAQDRTAHLKAGAYVCLEITDDGCGIEEAVLPRVFEPFFTTKFGHRGLGLAWVYGIVTNHGGGVSVASEVGQGTMVRIYLPALKKTVDDRPASSGKPAGSQTVLVVDDEEMVLTMAQMVLGAQGYRVLTASSGEKAIETMARAIEPIDLLITDLVMPGMNGRELSERVRSASPDTRIICASGCAPSQMASYDLDILSKPFTAQQLLQKVREALGE